MNNKNIQANNFSTRIIADDEVDLRELFHVIKEGKWVVFLVVALFSVASVVYALAQPNIYKSEALLAAAEQEQAGGLGALAGQFGGLASLAGVDLGSSSTTNKTQLALEVLKSRHFTSNFIQKHNILPDLMAVKSWELSDNRIEYNAEMYNEKENKWLREVNAPFKPEPSMQEAYEEFSQLITADMNKESGMITIAIEHVSPVIAQRWVNWLIEDINTVMKSRDVEEANKSTEFLTKQLEHTKVADIRTVLYKLIEEQTKTIMFANVRDEYVFKTIDPALVPEKKFKPGRALICIFGFLLGGFLGIVIVVSKYFLKNEK
ncbi:MAG TPA: LPS O-antigen length regulator [Pseudoalteromonas sp.]|uniref:Polysaccharide chain length determinant N-terminal domain-containing protein n=1 Tax=marine sediment metagenome TaxID=412755 RepID=A0A0F9QKV0_9ZZZZ|nr:Wzz/FepE/Etk N-terminal domain-containing protein [Pseudoalteromonas sp.]HDY90639.1 LPS O-antigen length regulator [Pseudoalteromonas sp.]HDZ33963.1 LPS O-antigen length regulator [Pseudoalteromonas sp.]